ncbi:MAG: zinc-binding alcohol dehydrogenase [Candidatus Latescibacterota bacterium]
MKRRVGGIDGSGRGVCLEEEVPSLGPGQVRVAVEASLISPGTELGGVPRLREDPQSGQAPRPFGYANAGRVVALGAGVTRFQLGQAVACMGAGYALHTDQACVPQMLCAPIPPGVSCEAAAFAHLAATGLQAVRRAAPVFGENAVVMGLGLVGQLSAQLAQLCGCHVLGVDRYALRRQVASRTGIERVLDPAGEDPVAAAAAFTDGFGMDFGILAFGGDATAAFAQVYRSLKQAPDTHRMGRIVIVGGAHVSHGFAAALGNVDVRSAARTGPGYHDEAWEHGAEYPRAFVEWTTQRNLAECLRAVAAGRLQVEPLITHRIRLENVAEAVDVLVQEPDKALGVILTP